MKKRLISMAMALLFIASLPISAFAEEYYLDKGSITVTASVAEGSTDTSYTVSQQTEGGEEQWTNYGETTSAPVIRQNENNDTTSSTKNTVTIYANTGANAKVTLSGVNIDASKDSTGKAAVTTDGAGNVTIELDGTNTVTGGASHAGVEKNNKGSLTITDANDTKGSLDAQGGQNGAGIGSGFVYLQKTEVSDINIEGGTVKAKGGDNGAGIGGGAFGTGTSITISGGTVEATGGKSGAGIGSGALGKAYEDTLTVSGDAEVKVRGGDVDENNHYGKGAAVGGGGSRTPNGNNSYRPVNGAEVDPDVSKLTKEGKIEYYNPGDDMSTVKPTKTIIGKYVPSVAAKAVSKTDSQTVTSYSVVDKDGKSIGYKTEVKDGVLTVTVDGDYAVLTGTAANIAALTAQGVTTAVFVTSGATSTFDLADLSAKGSGTYKLTHDGATVTFTLGTTDISEILK